MGQSNLECTVNIRRLGDRSLFCFDRRIRLSWDNRTDTGIGIPSDAREKLFTEFYRAGNAKDLNIPGTGLGLAIVKQIIEKVGGEISFESEIGRRFAVLFHSANR